VYSVDIRWGLSYYYSPFTIALEIYEEQHDNWASILIPENQNGA
jgi:hypothetical protein